MDGGSNKAWIDDITFPIGVGITVKSPTGGEIWFNGDVNKIKWASIGAMGGTVKIE